MALGASGPKVAVRFSKSPLRDIPAAPRVNVPRLPTPPGLEETPTDSVALPVESSAISLGVVPTTKGAEAPVRLSSPMALPKFSVNQIVPFAPGVRYRVPAIPDLQQGTGYSSIEPVDGSNSAILFP